MIVNLVKGSGVTGAIRYMQGEGRDDLTGKLKQRLGDRSRAELLGGQGCGFEIRSEADAELARKIMEFAARPDNQASRTKPCKLDCLHISLSWAKGQTPDRAEQIKAAEGILAALGMSKARAIYYAHHDAEYPHIHVVASRLNPETGRTYSGHEDVYRTQAWALQWERENNQITPAREWMHAIANAARSGNHKALQIALTEKEATFSRRAVDGAFAWAGYFGVARNAPRDVFLADPEIVPLRETADGPVKAYTTRHVLAAERALQRDARALHAGTLFALLPQGMVDQRRKFDLTREQAEALRHATEENRLAIIAGQAGVGKSRVFAAIREAYRAEGFDVRGVAWTNKVVVNMRRDGFEANTITSELQLIEREADAWRGGKTVLMVDEAAQLSTRNLAMLLKEARERGAKVILAGDERQLGSVERGGMFAVLQAEFGAAYLEQVQRVKDVDQQRAFNLMHGGKKQRDFAGAMAILDKRNAIHWSATRSTAVRDLGAKYIADVEAAPEKKRLMLARTNEEVRALNTFARTLHRERGALGEDHELDTAEGRAAFAVGDRITVTQNAPTRAVRQQGLINGAFGCVTEIEPAAGKKHEVTIELDGVGNNPGPRFRFVVGENRELGEFNGLKHGFATTVYKAQGDTLDQIYVLHSPGSRADSNYVALTRHREDVTLFVAKDHTKNVDELVRQMGQGPDKTAASSYRYVEREVAAKETALEMMRPARSPGDRDLKGDQWIERGDAAETARQASTSNATNAPGPVKLDGAFVLAPKPGKTVEGLREAFAGSSNGQDYMEALNMRRFRLAQVDGLDHAESVQRREDAEAANIRRKPRVLQVGELVAINRHGSVYAVNAYSTGANQAAIKAKLEGVDRATLPNLSTAYHMQRATVPQRGIDFRALEAARARGDAQGKAVGASMRSTMGEAKRTTMRAMAGFGAAAARVLDGMARTLEDFSLSPEQHAERKAMDQAIREAMPTRQEIRDHQHEQAYRREQDQKSAERQLPESQRHADATKQFGKDLAAERQHEMGWDTGRERGSGSR